MAVDKRKYLMSKKSYHQYELHVIEEELSALSGEVTSDDDSTLASEPANKGVAKQAAARTAAAAKPKAKEVEVESDGLDFLDEDADVATGPTEDDVKIAVKKFVAAFGKEKVVNLLQKFKAKAIQDVKEKDYTPFIELVNAALTKHKK